MPKRILIVESGIPVVPFEQSLLLRKEHDIYRASAGEEAIDLIKSGGIDLLITDDRLSDMDALEFASRLRELPQGHALSIMVLGSPPADGIAPGINKFVPKPVIGWEFEEACKALLSVEARKEVRLLVYVQVQGYLQSNLFLCNSVNMSPSGILLLTARKLKKGDHITLQITLPREREKVRVTGEVVREAREVGSRLNAYGVRFMDINDEDRERVKSFIIEAQAGGASG